MNINRISEHLYPSRPGTPLSSVVPHHFVPLEQDLHCPNLSWLYCCRLSILSFCSRQCASYLFRELVTRVNECLDHTCPASSTALLSGGEPQSLPQPHVLRTEANADLRHRDVCLLGVRGQGQHRVRGWAHPLYSRKSDPTCSSSDQHGSLKLSVVPLWL